MRSGRRSVMTWRLSAALAALAACSSPDDIASGCTAGNVRACACPGGLRGEQTCSTDRRYAACQCAPVALDAGPHGVDAMDVTDTMDAVDVVPAEAGLSDLAQQEAEAMVYAVAGCPMGSACDVDGDGVPGAQCSGNDCDDRDCRRYPGNAEVCDADGHDEDCDPCSVAGMSDGDSDSDTFLSATCRNRLTSAAPTCDPRRVQVDPANREVRGRDCADDDGNQRPDQPEICNGRDDNCNDRIDEDFRGGACGTGLPGACEAGTYQCMGGRLSCVSTVPVGSRAEACNGVDDDCDGMIDEDIATVGMPCPFAGGLWASDAPCRTGSLRCVAGREICENRNLRAEVCNGVDDDCDGNVDEAPETTQACALMNDMATCRAGSCVLASCSRGQGDCDGLVRNGCEANLASDPLNCGGCHIACEERCTDGWCDSGSQEIVAGRTHTCATQGSGQVVCWGDNAQGQIGNGRMGAEMTVPRPSVVTGVTDAVELAAGDGTFARLGTGRVQLWGRGTSTPGDARLSDVIAVGVDSAATSTGEVHTWDGAVFRATTPLVGVRALAGRAAYAILASGGVRHRPEGFVRPPWDVVPLPVAADGICAGDRFACVTTVDRRLWCWGANDSGQLADGSTADRELPAVVPLEGEVASVACGGGHACAVLTDGHLWCWGRNSNGQVGRGYIDSFPTGPTSVSFPSDARVARVTCGADHTCARLRDGRVFCWGANERGQLGNGMFTRRGSPFAVQGY